MKENEEIKLVKLIVKDCYAIYDEQGNIAGHGIKDIFKLAQHIDEYYKKD